MLEYLGYPYSVAKRKQTVNIKHFVTIIIESSGNAHTIPFFSYPENIHMSNKEWKVRQQVGWERKSKKYPVQEVEQKKIKTLWDFFQIYICKPRPN